MEFSEILAFSGARFRRDSLHCNQIYSMICRNLIVVLALANTLHAAPRMEKLLKQSNGWFASAEGRQALASILSWQTEYGDWPKNKDTSAKPYDDYWRVHFEVTRDLGKTWDVIGPIHDGIAFDAIQPSILTYKNGDMQVLCRSKQDVIAQSWSKDGGRSWSAMEPTDLPNPSAGTDAVTLSDGRQLLVYNHTKREPRVARRQILNVAISNDGQEWKPVLTLEKESRAKPADDRHWGRYSYPAVIQAADRKVHVIYTYNREGMKHVVLDPNKLK